MVIPSDAVSIVGIGQVPVLQEHELSLRQLGAAAVHRALAEAGIDHADALFVGNMLADELQGQKHLATLVADEAGLRGIEALQVRAATATGAAALRMAYLAVASGQAEVAVALGVEKMSSDRSHVVSSLAKALDAELEVPTGATLLSQNAKLVALYLERYGLSIDDFDGFALNAHANANHNPNALFHDRTVTAEQVDASPIVSAPLRLYDAAPICDGAAAVVLTSTRQARAFTDRPVAMLGASVVTDRFRIEDRDDPLHLAAEGRIRLDGDLPISTMGGLKARGHPIGASAIYQTCEIVQQLTGRAGANQLADPKVALLQSVGGAGGTVLTHIFGT